MKMRIRSEKNGVKSYFRGRPALFRGRHFEDVVIMLCVRWYLRYSLSYRDLEDIMAERGLSVDHVTIWRWIQRFATILNQRLRRVLNIAFHRARRPRGGFSTVAAPAPSFRGGCTPFRSPEPIQDWRRPDFPTSDVRPRD